MLNVVNYVCPEHREDFNLQDSIMSCPCYRLLIPTYITMDESVKTTANLLLDGAFATELMGDAGTVANRHEHRAVCEAALTQFDMCRLDTTRLDAQNYLEDQVYVYVDPAYTNNTDASGTGIAIVSMTRHHPRRCVVLALEHFFLRDLTGTAGAQIASCAVSAIRGVVTLHKFITCANVAVEGNSSQDSAMAIASAIQEKCPIDVHFAHYADKTTTLRWPIYMMGPNKGAAFEAFIYAMNSGALSASQTLVSNTIRINFDPVGYLLEQVRAIKSYPLKDGSFTYSAKQRAMSDDTLVALVMAHYFASTNKINFKPINYVD